MSATNSLHYQLCCEGAKWLRNKKNRERWRGHWKYVWVEPGLVGENPDIWAFNGDDTICIEVKTSHADFVADQKKWWRRAENDSKVGMFRYYLAPKDVIKPEELPEGWGLLEWDGTIIRGRFNIEKVTSPMQIFPPSQGDLHIIGSLLRREGLKEGIYNYRGQATTIKPKTVNGVIVKTKYKRE